MTRFLTLPAGNGPRIPGVVGAPPIPAHRSGSAFKVFLQFSGMRRPQLQSIPAPDLHDGFPPDRAMPHHRRTMKLLIIEDDPTARDFLAKGLREAGHVVDAAADGKQGLFMASSERYDAWIVDRMLPHVDGLKIISTLRATGDHTPALILSALGEVDDRVRGLRAGGDDYLVKPYALAELMARLEAITRRVAPEEGPQTLLEVADLQLDLLSRTARRGDQVIDLKPQEFRLLEYLMRHADRVVTRTMLLEGVWDYHFDPQTNVVDVHISRLRSKIDLPGATALIHTVRGAGYVLRVANK